MEVTSNRLELKNILASLNANNYAQEVALVPTMGALHQGHLSLIDKALEKTEQVIATIFVNPFQFGANEDFAHYPKDITKDLEMLSKAGVKVVFTPNVGEMYPEGFSTNISIGPLARAFCGAARPEHFDGVCLVVSKLFNLIQPQYGVFGEKDFQQLFIIKKMVSELDMPIKIIGAPTIRNDDGLALSSRNSYLNTQQRKIASQLYARMCTLAEWLQAGMRFKDARAQTCQLLLEDGFSKIDYLDMVDQNSLDCIEIVNSSARLLIALYLDNIRLIDNIKVIT